MSRPRKKTVLKARRAIPRTWNVLIRLEGRKIPFAVRMLRSLVSSILLESAFSKLPKGFSEVSLLFTDDPTIHRLNLYYRGKDKATDVLSFPQEENWGTKMLSPSLGDLVISVQTARAQAREFCVSIREELLRLIIHGLLHLAGYDHEKVPAREAQRMRRAEKKLMAKYSDWV
jgi:probable rRNA maturation factor